jgi:predicted phosphoribosyltransferase
MFRDRREAGQQLAALLGSRIDASTIIAGLPRGGLPIAQEVQRRWGGQLTSVLVRKLGVPGHEEFAFGAIAPGTVRVIDPVTVARLGLTPESIEEVVQREEGELVRRSQLFPHLSPREYVGKSVIIVDDGIATGATAQAAVTAVFAMGAHDVTVAAPVASREAVQVLQDLGADVVIVDIPSHFGAVGAFYEEFPQVTDQEVIAILAGQ